jgi:hypothetical protein
MKVLLEKAQKNGVLATKKRAIPPVAMKPRAKVATNAWGSSVATTPEVYQVICYSQYTYKYTLQVNTAGVWSDVASTTSLISATLDGNNGPILFQAQPTLPAQPVYRVARTGPNGAVTHEPVVWENYTTA